MAEDVSAAAIICEYSSREKGVAALRGINSKNRLMGNSLLDIIVFGRIAGKSAAQKSKETTTR